MNDMKLKTPTVSSRSVGRYAIKWAVVNTVIATKARTVCGKYGDRYFTIGPDLGQGADREFEEDPAAAQGVAADPV